MDGTTPTERHLVGYTTEFTGNVTVTPPLNPHEITYLRKFANTRRMDRANGPYFTEGSDGAFGYGQGNDADIHKYNDAPAGQPSLWCDWEPSDDGTQIAWNGTEKFYGSVEWMSYLIDHFLKPEAHAATYTGPHRPAAFDHFTFNHAVEGVIHAQGEDQDDTWKLIVSDNQVMVAGNA